MFRAMRDRRQKVAKLAAAAARLSAPLPRTERLAESRKVLALLGVAGPRSVSALVALALISGLVPVVFLVATSLLLGDLPDAIAGGWDSGAGEETRTLLIVAGVCFTGQLVARAVQVALNDIVARRIDGAMRDRLLAASMLGADIATVEDDVSKSLLAEAGKLLQYTFTTPGWAAVALVWIVSRYVTLVAGVVVVSVAYAWWAGPLLLAAGLYNRVRMIAGLRRSAASDDDGQLQREAEYFGHTLGLQASVGKELRIFDLAGWIRGRFERPLLQLHTRRSEVRRTVGFPVPVRESFVLMAAAAVVLVLAARSAADGDLALSGFVFVLISGAAVLQGGFADTYDFVLSQGLRGLHSLEQFERHAAEAPRRELTRARVAVGARPSREIAFERVTFAYPGRDTPVLSELDLSIPAGRSLAIVGANGAGKTTLVKLLAGLYEPTGGRIAVDGVDLRELDRAEWQRRVAPIFQDFVHYELTAADNIGFGAVHRLGDERAIRRAAERAGVLDVLEGLGSGLETTLSSRYAGGVDLSGGQWQRVATARALAAIEADAGVLVLDEPTANLDVRSEVAFFERVLELTQGCTTIVISHRFSTVRRVDRIVVLDGGTVVEDGSHDELLAADGRYAEMFRLQARRFADDPGDGA